MSAIIERKIAARIEGDFVVFLIGMRIKQALETTSVVAGGERDAAELKELEAAPAELGFLGYTNLGLTALVQYWRSFDQLEAYARARDREHWPAWVDFNLKMKDSRGDVGIWHETYLVRSGEYEAVYSGMPLVGLARAGQRAEATGEFESARGRLGAKV